MKITVVLAINLIIFSSFLGTANLTAQKNPVGTINEIEIKVNFNGKKAKDRIEKELSREKGILKVTVNPEHKVVIVKFNHSTDTKKINSALEKMGYTTALSTIEKKQSRNCKPITEQTDFK